MIARRRPLVRTSRFARGVLCLLVGGIAVQRASYAADGSERWVATSTTAMSITGNVTFAPDRLTFQNGKSLPLSLVGPANGFKAMGEIVQATLYRVTAPADITLMNGNHLCGGGAHGLAVTYVAVWVPDPLPGDKKPRALAASSDKEPPHGTGGSASCGVYNYEAGR